MQILSRFFKYTFVILGIQFTIYQQHPQRNYGTIQLLWSLFVAVLPNV